MNRNRSLFRQSFKVNLTLKICKYFTNAKIKLCQNNKRKNAKQDEGTGVAQSVKCLTLAQIMMSQFPTLSPTLGSVLTARSLEPALDSVSPSLSAPPLPTLCVSLKKKNRKIKTI